MDKSQKPLSVVLRVWVTVLWGFALAFAAATPVAFAQTAGSSAVSTRDRAALLAALRVKSERDLGRPVVFVVKTITVRGDVAFVATMPQRPNSQPIDIRQTPVGRRGEGGEWDGVHTEGLFFMRRGRWVLEHYSVGSTDVWYDNPELCPRYGTVLPAPICQR
jgi:hypothetical protein